MTLAVAEALKPNKPKPFLQSTIFFFIYFQINIYNHFNHYCHHTSPCVSLSTSVPDDGEKSKSETSKMYKTSYYST